MKKWSIYFVLDRPRRLLGGDVVGQCAEHTVNILIYPHHSGLYPPMETRDDAWQYTVSEGDHYRLAFINDVVARAAGERS